MAWTFSSYRSLVPCASSNVTALSRAGTKKAQNPRSTLSTQPLLCNRTPSRLSSSSMSQPECASPTDRIGQAAHNEVSQSGNTDDALVQYVVLRRDLIESWQLGSVVTQSCHASVSAIWSNKDDPHTIQYCSPQNIDSMRKVTLEVKGETQMLNLSEKLKTDGIIHKLWIEQPENMPTCLATKPYPKSIVSPYFKKLKLCK